MKTSLRFKAIGFASLLAVALFTTSAPPLCADSSDREKNAEAPPTSLLAHLAHDAISENAEISAKAIAGLREAGPDGLRALFDATAELVKKNSGALAIKNPDPAWRRFCAAADAVGKQRDDFASQLYWFTDLEKAKSAAKASGKPILSLRLLGKLDEEFSCANSRFFRTILYANADVSRHLREHFILHWESVRPVPKVSIDFGDGRVMNCTVTGNSIHYILDADGHPIDALPGLYGPAAFLRGLAVAENAAANLAKQPAESRGSFLREYHRVQLANTLARWNNDLAKIDLPATATGGLNDLALRVTSAAPPTAMKAQPLATSKSAREIPLVRAIAPTHETLVSTTGDAQWKKIAQLHANDARLDDTSKALIVAKNPTAFDASRLAVLKYIVENPLLRVVRTLERSTAEDTVRNEYLLHTAIHEWFINGSAAADLKKLNERVYAELFLTPSNDPWLGLRPVDVYSALPDDGVVTR